MSMNIPLQDKLMHNMHLWKLMNFDYYNVSLFTSHIINYTQ